MGLRAYARNVIRAFGGQTVTYTENMTPEELAAWEEMAKSGRLRAYLDCDEGNYANRNGTRTFDTAYHRELARRTAGRAKERA